MQHPSVLILPTSSANDEHAQASASIPQTPTATASTPEELAVRLRREGKTYPEIIEATGLSERQVRKLVKGVAKEIDTPLNKSVNRVYELAIRAQGIKNYELRGILHEEYGCKWNSEKGRYESSFDSNVIKRVKENVRDRSTSNDTQSVFVMDWVDDQAPTASRIFLEQSALTLMARVEEAVNEFMELHAACGTEDSEGADLTHRKQAFAAKQHILKLVSGLGTEPVAKLLERTVEVTNALQGTPDHEAPSVRNAEDRRQMPEPTGADHFLDFVESQGWLTATN
ncbi:TPA: helix-turn-helix domain-containing protein [Pseudomonas aeruginosa]|uniref:helix-turn-helix domain-containing protein n=1 Tax=Pseudomonas aeruginosa TaxID=287 RepID=UPI001069E417|nr:helix-turn-helix domain-containing protein [Pseudomonas aeruginosa]ELW3044996.1 helix-turn-helix domain-containing protein [Pseudomonas aeruginosa]MCO2324669.1 helix-turn-helix domain-containing protein [Pseudomonas aeruginosa]HBO2026849.1 helix-turn-helix domain-containing protein [Pseudomonas aeruginosa]HBP1889042.1 helix-turn-helix domain-containing protein [Pseudomonas aeruginosa]HCH7471827.1 helix-turn-helix domain-containing protein [Pseudomonas aeruginosa]